MAADAVSLLGRDDLRLTPALDAERHLALADALIAIQQPEPAIDAARKAGAMFRRQGREWFQRRARLTAVRARSAIGDARGLARDARVVAEELHEERAIEAPLALTLAGQVGPALEAAGLWAAAASYRSHPNALVRAGAWHAQALSREEAADRGGVLRAAAAGLDAIDEHRRLIGSSELRALATTHGRELTTIALRHAATDPRTLLRWSERTRATALAQPPATSDAATIPASLAALRDNGRRLAEARQDGDPTEDLEKERLRLERAVRAEHHTLSADSVERQRPVSAEEVVASVGDGCLVELVDVDGTLHVLVVHGGKVRRRIAGGTTEIAELLGPAAMLLRRTSRGRPADLTALGQRLQDAILGDAVRLIPEGLVVIAPTARLHGLPWALLPALHDRPFSVVPSAGQLLRARAAKRPKDPRTVLICGPGLATGGAEVPVLAKRHPDAVLLDGAHATLEAVLAQLDGADLVHLAAHGNFRADSPLFSALDLADGPLTVHDLERLQRAPYRVVLSACESGVLAPVGAEELLGLAAALFSLGTAGLVSSVAEVNDVATADLMVDLHAALAAGRDPATALHEVRRAAVPGSVEAATAAAFVALGV
ncbi:MULTISPECIES: CHAT domain-containing protein [unclassified Nocardioides]|uniref:CHAT domain-containing protein n=1 Tax=unclassified Nocardioides TaxID=2615069 RepID=UPI00138EE35A|nr:MULTISPECIES: CHAT domain-containing protein [unclassified Nocardioides]